MGRLTETERWLLYVLVCCLGTAAGLLVSCASVFGPPDQGYSTLSVWWSIIAGILLAVLTEGLSILAQGLIGLGTAGVVLTFSPKYPIAKAAFEAGGGSSGWDWKTWAIVVVGGWWLIKFFAPRYREQALKFLGNLLTLRLPSAAKSLAKASGMAHTRE